MSYYSSDPRMRREQAKAMRMQNAQAAMDMFSPSKQLDVLQQLQQLRQGQQTMDFRGQLQPYDVENAQLQNEQLRNTNAYAPQQANAELQGQQLQNQSLMQQLQDYLSQRQFEEQRRGWAVDDRQYELQQRPVREQQAQAEVAARLIPYMYGTQYDPAVKQLLERMGLPFNSTQQPQQEAPAALSKLQGQLPL